MQIPQIQIRQQQAQLSIDTDLGQLEMRQPKATFELRTVAPKLHIHSEEGQLSIDNSRWQDAIGLGHHLESMSRIYSTCKEIAIQGVARRVQEGNRMAAIQTGANVFADLAKESMNDVDNFQFMYLGNASYDNIDIRYESRPVDIQVEEGRVEKNIQMNRAEVQYHLGKRDIYLAQFPKVEIIPPQLDIKI
ncbi:DUF6470 family protein [Paenibacillus allorhizosphaerae]|uniref:DUF2345 domain-containing protein n=1 Tax=Paenibacillus allorhizosphaerae TaxID=2849866 RepID=A0ABM8VRN9_9BACL|nr:DUF6470 family protein [Paenibacillus allorhizosphaerae]CAG7655454.1 putative protein YviE [Paenibacillus allorhizosphaerae]